MLARSFQLFFKTIGNEQTTLAGNLSSENVMVEVIENLLDTKMKFNFYIYYC